LPSVMFLFHCSGSLSPSFNGTEVLGFFSFPCAA